ncbi:putative cation/H+ exchanger, sodium/solute symporter superfamily [Septoria linicola]|nr:putative cation/H+ exchanger, sodium/solute symporter superfamily [Septoria linicola]
MSSLTAYLPQHEGYLPKWLLFIAIVSIGNTIQCYRSLSGSKEVYSGRPYKTDKNPSPVNELSARTFGTWTALSSVVRLYAAYNISDPKVYELCLWTYGIAFAHFLTEWLAFGSAKWGRGLASPVADYRSLAALVSSTKNIAATKVVPLHLSLPWNIVVTSTYYSGSIKSNSHNCTNNDNMVASILWGDNPLKYNPADPITLLLFQIIVILATCNLVHLILHKLWQPRVISEVIGGLILGPSVLGHIPNFTQSIFPAESKSMLNGSSTLGLIFLMFLVGLEVDMSGLKNNLKPALMVSIFGMAVPFGLGCAVAVGMFEHFQDSEQDDFGVFVLFIGLALCITAFPILARILMSCDLLHSPVGIIAIAAGVANDVVGWSLLALAVALANAGSGSVALYIILCCIGLVLFMFFAIAPVLRQLDARLTFDHFLAVALVVVLVASMFTAMIGIHPIFGAFIAGLVMPKGDDFRDCITNRLSALVYNVLLPPFFALCGLNTDVSSLKEGLDWAYVVAVVAIAFFGKTIAGFAAARLCSMPARESWTVGILMSCKGIVELIALNIGLEAGIISEKCYTAMVIMAILLTGCTQPLVCWIYPARRRIGNDKENSSSSNSTIEERSKAEAC